MAQTSGTWPQLSDNVKKTIVYRQRSPKQAKDAQQAKDARVALMEQHIASMRAAARKMLKEPSGRLPPRKKGK